MITKIDDLKEGSILEGMCKAENEFSFLRYEGHMVAKSDRKNEMLKEYLNKHLVTCLYYPICGTTMVYETEQLEEMINGMTKLDSYFRNLLDRIECDMAHDDFFITSQNYLFAQEYLRNKNGGREKCI